MSRARMSLYIRLQAKDIDPKLVMQKSQGYARSFFHRFHIVGCSFGGYIVRLRGSQLSLCRKLRKSDRGESVCRNDAGSKDFEFHSLAPARLENLAGGTLGEVICKVKIVCQGQSLHLPPYDGALGKISSSCLEEIAFHGSSPIVLWPQERGKRGSLTLYSPMGVPIPPAHLVQIICRRQGDSQ